MAFPDSLTPYVYLNDDDDDDGAAMITRKQVHTVSSEDESSLHSYPHAVDSFDRSSGWLSSDDLERSAFDSDSDDSDAESDSTIMASALASGTISSTSTWSRESDFEQGLLSGDGQDSDGIHLHGDVNTETEYPDYLIRYNTRYNMDNFEDYSAPANGHASPELDRVTRDLDTFAFDSDNEEEDDGDKSLRDRLSKNPRFCAPTGAEPQRSAVLVKSQSPPAPAPSKSPLVSCLRTEGSPKRQARRATIGSVEYAPPSLGTFDRGSNVSRQGSHDEGLVKSSLSIKGRSRGHSRTGSASSLRPPTPASSIRPGSLSLDSQAGPSDLFEAGNMYRTPTGLGIHINTSTPPLEKTACRHSRRPLSGLGSIMQNRHAICSTTCLNAQASLDVSQELTGDVVEKTSTASAVKNLLPIGRFRSQSESQVVIGPGASPLSSASIWSRPRRFFTLRASPSDAEHHRAPLSPVVDPEVKSRAADLLLKAL